LDLLRDDEVPVLDQELAAEAFRERLAVDAREVRIQIGDGEIHASLSDRFRALEERGAERAGDALVGAGCGVQAKGEAGRRRGGGKVGGAGERLLHPKDRRRDRHRARLEDPELIAQRSGVRGARREQQYGGEESPHYPARADLDASPRDRFPHAAPSLECRSGTVKSAWLPGAPWVSARCADPPKSRPMAGTGCPAPRPHAVPAILGTAPELATKPPPRPPLEPHPRGTISQQVEYVRRLAS